MSIHLGKWLKFGDKGGRSPLVWVMIGLLTLWLWAIGAPLLAQTQASVEELRQQQQQLDQQRSQLEQKRQQVQQQESSAQTRLQGLQQTIRATSSQIQQSEQRLAQANQDLAKLSTNLEKAETAYRTKQSATVARLRFLQQQQVDRGWAVLLQSQNLTEFLDRRRRLSRVYGADRAMLASLKQVADRIEQQRTQVERKKNEVALLTQQLYSQKAEFEGQAASQQAMVDRLRSDRRALEAAENQLEQDSQQIQRLIQQRVASSRGLAVRGTGQFIFPSNGPVTSIFGWRIHPILGYRRFHAGIDFGADYGSPIFAADSGVVIFAGWYGGYGNAVIVDHGGGITTLYGHASQLYVREGETVQRGQAIAAIGSTGLSTGPHLHFEVRRNGEPTDPAAFL